MKTIVYESDPNAPKIVYLCDRKACEDCSYPMCEHTSDIAHAINFEHIRDVNVNVYVEKECEYGD